MENIKIKLLMLVNNFTLFHRNIWAWAVLLIWKLNQNYKLIMCILSHCLHLVTKVKSCLYKLNTFWHFHILYIINTNHSASPVSLLPLSMIPALFPNKFPSHFYVSLLGDSVNFRRIVCVPGFEVIAWHMVVYYRLVNRR